MDIDVPQETPVIKNASPILTSIVEKCKIEAARNHLSIPIKDVDSRVFYYTGIPIEEIQKIINKESTYKTCSYGFKMKILIIKCLLKLYAQPEQPTYRSLFKEINGLRLDIQDYEIFEKEATLLGFEYRTVCNKIPLLMEDPQITFQRNSYLRRILKLRESNALVYYIGERIIDGNKNFHNLSHQNADELARNSDYLVLHAVSRNGLTSCMFTVNINENDYFKWIVDILLDQLEPSSVIVMYNNNPLHGTPPKPISMYDTKNDMYKWLISHNVPCSKSMSKFQLYELIKKNPAVEEITRVERVLKMNGHEVLYLPKNFEDLSLIDVIWTDFKELDLQEGEVKDIVLAYLHSLRKQCGDYECKIKKRELELHTTDTTLETILENRLLRL